MLELILCSTGLMAVIGCLSYYILDRTKNENGQMLSIPLVPGGVPLLGHVQGFDRQRPHLTLYDWAKRYGDLFRFKVLRENVVVVNSKELIREALIAKGHLFAGRPYIFRIHYGFHYSDDIIFGDVTPKWIEMKKFAATALKKFSVGVNNVEEIVREEMVDLKYTLLESSRMGAFDPSMILMTSVVNALTASVSNQQIVNSYLHLGCFVYKC